MENHINKIQTLGREKIHVPKWNAGKEMPDYVSSFIDLLKIQSASDCEVNMVLSVLYELKTIPGVSFNIDIYGNITVTRGLAASYICLCAHLDAVHDIVENYEIKLKKGIFSAHTGGLQVGTGGDDKCGIFAILHTLKTTKKPLKAVFFTREEIGCIGSGNIDINFFNDVGLLVGIDRRGGSDLITEFYGEKTISEEAENFILPFAEKYKYAQTSGIITDVFTIQNRLKTKISSINLSCGYYYPHTKGEIISLYDFNNCLLLVSELVNNYNNESVYIVDSHVDDYINYYLDFENTDFEKNYYDNYFDVEAWINSRYLEIYNLSTFEAFNIYKNDFGKLDYENFSEIYENLMFI